MADNAVAEKKEKKAKTGFFKQLKGEFKRLSGLTKTLAKQTVAVIAISVALCHYHIG